MEDNQARLNITYKGENGDLPDPVFRGGGYQDYATTFMMVIELTHTCADAEGLHSFPFPLACSLQVYPIDVLDLSTVCHDCIALRIPV